MVKKIAVKALKEISFHTASPAKSFFSSRLSRVFFYSIKFFETQISYVYKFLFLFFLSD